MEKAAGNPGAAGEGIGMGLGFMMPSMVSRMFEPGGSAPRETGQRCPDCNQMIPDDAVFCPFCGHQIMVFQRCSSCGKNLSPKARFCPRCGARVERQTKPRICSKCGAENLFNSNYCNNCGEKL